VDMRGPLVVRGTTIESETVRYGFIVLLSNNNIHLFTLSWKSAFTRFTQVKGRYPPRFWCRLRGNGAATPDPDLEGFKTRLRGSLNRGRPPRSSRGSPGSPDCRRRCSKTTPLRTTMGWNVLRRRRLCSLEKPPRVTWKLGPGKKYAVFLSHYKDEAGMEARYLRDLLQKVLRKPCFLDSQNLSSLNNLFTHGLLCSDAVVLLATKDVLRRPYCLLELWCAQQTGVPIVILEISGRNFSWTDAARTLEDIEGSLESPEAVALIDSTLKSLVGKIGAGEPPTLKQFGKDIGTALRVQERQGAAWTETSVRSGTNTASVMQATFHPWATDSGIIAAVSDVVDLLFLSVGTAPPPRLAREHLLGHRKQSLPLPGHASLRAIVQRGSSRADSMRRGLGRGFLGHTNASNELSPGPTLRSAGSVRKSLFTSDEWSSSPSPRRGQPGSRAAV